ncbi:MAG: manganese efflux pump [Clostridia bacterium]|nr:manganese efflux pump [Clostridia bacterium]
MTVLEIVLIGMALAMDACAVAMTNGMTDSKMPLWKVLRIGVFFGFFQFMMPLIGYFITGLIADAFLDAFKSISAWISFALLAFLGGKMLFECISEKIKEKREKDETAGAGTCSCSACQPQTGVWKLTVQAIATSIDALAVGVTLQMAAIQKDLALGVWGATAVIGVVTLGLAIGAVYIGKLVGNKLADKAGIVGGLVLLGIGLKILIESFL